MKLSELLKGLEDNTLVKINSQEIEEKLDDQALIDISKRLKNNTSVTEIHIDSDLLSSKGIEVICASLKYNKQIHTLALSSLKNHSDWLTHIVQMLKFNTHIETLKLNNNHLTDTILEPLIKVIGHNNVKNLYLDDNFLTNKSIQNIIAIYKIRHHLTLLSLKNNHLFDTDIQLIANYLGMKSSLPFQAEAYLTQLFLDKNQITDLGIEYLADAMNNNRFLTTLSIADNSYSEKAKIALTKISVILSSNQEFFKRYQASGQFLPLDQHFKKIAEKPGKGENPGGIYLNLNDNSIELIKLNPGEKTGGERIGAIQEYTAGNLMALLIPDYPKMIIVLDGGSFKVGYAFIEDLTSDHSKINSDEVIKYIFESYLMCYLFADPDAPGNRWFYKNTKDNDTHFYKGDLGMAFHFTDADNIQSIDIDTISNEHIAKFFQLPIELVNAYVTNETKIAVLNAFLKISDEQIKASAFLMTELLGEYGENNVKELLKRAEQVRTAIPTLIWQLQKKEISKKEMPPKTAQFISFLGSKTASKSKEEELEQKPSTDTQNYRRSSF